MPCIIRDKTLIIPADVISIEDSEFYNNKTFMSIYFEPRELGCSIGNSAFKSCYIKTLLIPKQVIIIGNHAFADNMWLDSVQFEHREPNMPLILSEHIFDNCDIREIIIPPFITEIQSLAFFQNKKLRSIIFEPRGNLLLRQSDNLLPQKINTVLSLKIGKSVFANCNIGPSLIIPNFVIIIGNLAFCLSTNLIDLAFEPRDTQLIIGRYAFEKCSLNGSLIIHPQIKIENSAFLNNIHLRKVIISKEYILIAERIFKCNCSLSHIQFIEYYGDVHNKERRAQFLIFRHVVKKINRLLPWLPENKMKNLLKILSLTRYDYLARHIESFI